MLTGEHLSPTSVQRQVKEDIPIMAEKAPNSVISPGIIQLRPASSPNRTTSPEVVPEVVQTAEVRSTSLQHSPKRTEVAQNWHTSPTSADFVSTVGR